MIENATGNLLAAPAEAWVNAVNLKGVMGKGLALQFKQRYPAMFHAYARACAAGEVRLGAMHVFDLGTAAGQPRWIINFPTKDHWRGRSHMADIRAGLTDLIATVRSLDIQSIAVPALGCGLGGLDWRDVRPLIVEAFAGAPSVRVLLYGPV